MTGVSLSWPIRPIQYDPDIFSKYYLSETGFHIVSRVVTRALVGAGGVYLYIRVLPDEFVLKSVVIRFDFKRNSSGRT